MSLYPKGTNPVVRLPEVLAVGFTGHRKVPYEAKSRQVIRDFLARQKESHPGILYGISSAASGGDQLFAESCLELDIPLRILLPRPAEQFRADFDDASWQRTVRIVEKAISVELTGEPESQSDQYYDCGIQTVAESQLLDGAVGRLARPRRRWHPGDGLLRPQNRPSHRLDSQRNR